MMDGLMIVAGLLLLFFGGEALVRGSVAISKKLGISTLLIGMVVVGFGTSAPELLVSVQASLAGQTDIALGNVVGSNIANVLLILGLAGVISPVLCQDRVIHRDALAVLAATLALWGLSYVGVISLVAGGLMLAALVGYLVYAYRSEQKAKKNVLVAADGETPHEHEADEFDTKMGLGLSVVLSIGGIAMLVFGADFLVAGASNLARLMGVSEAVIGLSLVAVGTSLPELVTAISAALKKNSDVIIGNVLGSNLFNILSILGVAAVIKPLPMGGQIAHIDIPVALAVAVVTAVIILWRKKISRVTGAVFILLYAVYMVWMYTQGGVA